MNSIAGAFITGVATFAATNIDDILVLTVFYSQVGGAFRKAHIVAGQYLGFSALVVISLLGFVVGLVVQPQFIGLLGLAPIAIGIRRLLLLRRRENPAEAVEKIEKVEAEAAQSSVLSGLFSRQTFSVAAVTFANGGDNIGIYTPLFASSSAVRVAVLLAVFFVLLGVWCYAGDRLARQPAVARAFSRYGHIFVPFVLIGLGLYIMLESGTFDLLGM